MECVACGKKLNVLGFRSNFKIYRCSNCGLGQTIGTGAQASDYHRDETYIQEVGLFKNIFQKRVRIINSIKKPGLVLEIGCSTGLMLSLLRDLGWQVEGIEISKGAIIESKKRNIKVYQNHFEDFKTDKKYDLIILNHTLEHLKNPVLALSKIHKLLKSNGLLFIDVPNFGGLRAKLEKADWSLLLPEEHYFHFTKESLDFLFEKSGFKYIFVNRSSGIWDYDQPIKGLYLSLFNLKKRFFTEFLTALPSFIVSRFNLGSGLIIVARRIDL